MKKYIYIFILSLIGTVVNAQQDAMFTQYMYNTMSVNPAYAGSKNILTTTALHRSQWIGFEGSPQTQTITIDAPFYEENIGIGASIINDKIGPVNSSSINFDFSYRIRITKKSKLAFGLKGGVNLLNIKLSELWVHDKNENIFQQNIDTRIMPNFGFGLFYYTQKFYIGCSVPKLLKNKFSVKELASSMQNSKQTKHFFIISGATFQINDDIKIKPSTIIKITANAPIQMDISPVIMYKDYVWGGLMYRTGDALGLLFGLNITKQFASGYSFDWSLVNKTAIYNAGTHELMLQYYYLLKPKPKVMSPRHF